MTRTFFFLIIIITCFVLIFILQDTDYFISHPWKYPIPQIKPKSSEPTFLVSSSKCKILNLEPFNSDVKKFFGLNKYERCHKLDLLTYVRRTGNTTTLHIDDKILPSYFAKKSKGISCCYSNVTRGLSWRTADKNIWISNCTQFANNVTVHTEVISIKCTDKSTNKLVYENVHAILKDKKKVQQKIASFNNNTKQLSVLILGIDSISRLNFIRTLPKTYKYVTDNGWATLNGYNKIEDNTFPNLMAILTGYNRSYSYLKCNPRELSRLDFCPLLWYDFGELGYITGYAEDSGRINTFNYRKTGFIHPPVDYYFRPYILAAEKLKIIEKSTMKYCTGPETSGERILNVAKDFLIKFKGYPQFSLFWMNTFSHAMLNAPSRLDDKIKQFLDFLKSSGVLENVIVIFLSDHGMRSGDFRLTPAGWLEERLPFIFVSFPKRFKEKYSLEYGNFLSNKYKLTSPYDLYMTLQHILVLSGHKYAVKPSDACPRCHSLFQNVSQDRSCEEAGIEPHWCTCPMYKEARLTKELINTVVKFVINGIEDILYKHPSGGKCMKFTLTKLISLRLSEKFSFKNDTYILVQFQTYPKAIFESTVLYEGKIEDEKFQLGGSISRVDTFGGYVGCIDDVNLEKYCHCQTKL